MDKLLQELGLDDYIGNYTSGKKSFVIDLNTDLDFGKVYSILEDNDQVEQLDDTTLLTVHNASIVYEYEDYQLTLKGNFDTEEYSLVIMELKHEDSNN